MDTDPRSPVVLAPHFEFLPIDSSRGQVRLLQIAPGRDDEPIRCSYQIASVNENVPYYTLSYVWGKMDRNRTIIVEGTKAELTDNLFDALTCIRHEHRPRYLWVDALCINQQDREEKTAQVNMMHRIYSNCLQCNMWLGKISDISIGATEEETLKAAKGALGAIQVLAGKGSDSHLPPYLANREQKMRAGKALKELMHTAWWSRIWTVQEATSPRDATILWGPLSISWNFMKLAAERLITGIYPPNDRLAIEDVFEHGNYGWFTAPILGLIWASRWIEQPHSTLGMLWRFRYRDSTDPRDKVYVILNLVAEGTNPLPSVPSSDYTINTTVLYRRVMLDLFREESGLRPLIGLRTERKSVPGLPSWVVDWSLPPHDFSFQSFWEHNHFWLDYTADRGLPMLDVDRMTWPEYGDDVLNVNGLFFDKVLVCSDLIARHEGNHRLQEMVTKVIRKALAEEPRYRIISEVYWQKALVNIIEGNYADPDDVYEGATGVEYWRSEMLRYQRLFITENGAVGLGPSGTSIGDEVWILSGGRSPFLLSPLHSNGVDVKDQDASYHYTLRGDVFVPGIMAGEAVDSRIDNQRFVHIH
ncbi:HET-domain-containing protein [Xylaria cf. heliscus]|nr:HET-domain-containing protein [Xylaria cf. heliscus]